MFSAPIIIMDVMTQLSHEDNLWSVLVYLFYERSLKRFLQPLDVITAHLGN